MSSDLSGEITAIATAVLAVFAIITGIYAVRAFRKQAREVSDQAEMLRIQSEQLDEQRVVNAEQVRVLALQAEELRASLEARQQASLELRYQYASTVAAWQDEPYRSGMGWTVVAHVLNTGDRPVRDLSARWYADNEQIRPEAQTLTVCLLPGKQHDFDSDRVDGASITKGLSAIVDFRTVGDDWWCTGTDGTLVGGMEISDTPPRSLRP
jgi:hypothetical protein